MLDSAPDAIARLMAAFRAGDSRAGGQLMELFYPELKRLAAGHLNSGNGTGIACNRPCWSTSYTCN